jgi:hypothetical protein
MRAGPWTRMAGLEILMGNNMFYTMCYIYTICAGTSEVTTPSNSLGFLALSSLQDRLGRHYLPNHRYAAKFSICRCNLVLNFSAEQVASNFTVPICCFKENFWMLESIEKFVASFYSPLFCS